MLGSVARLSPEQLAVRCTVGSIAMVVAVTAAERLMRCLSATIALLVPLVFLIVGHAGFVGYEQGLAFFQLEWPAAVSGVGCGMLMSVLAVMACRDVPPARLAAAASLFALSTSGPPSAWPASCVSHGPDAGGRPLWGYRMVFIVETVINLLTVPLVFVLHKLREDQS